MPSPSAQGFPGILADYCRVRLCRALSPHDLSLIRSYLLEGFEKRELPPVAGDTWSWAQIAHASGVDQEHVVAARHDLRPILIVLERELGKGHRRPPTRQRKSRNGPTPIASAGPEQVQRMKPGVKPRPVIEFPAAAIEAWDDPSGFAEALNFHMKRHGDTGWNLHKAIVLPGETFDRTTLSAWRRGRKAPQSAESLGILSRIEHRYRLPAGYFRQKLPHPCRSTTGFHLPGIPAAERRRLAWHLPDDFDDRSATQREEILDWVRNVVISGATDYRRYQAAAAKTRYSLRFPNLTGKRSQARKLPMTDLQSEDFDPDLLQGGADAPASLEAEMTALVRFKTSTLTAFGFQRNGVWGTETASQKIEHLGLLFGSLAGPQTGPIRGLAVPVEQLSMALLIFPSVWDWYVQWRERRRGFYTRWEVEMLHVACALVRKGTGWMRQTPSLAVRLVAIEGLVTEAEIAAARDDWEAACDRLYDHALARSKEIARVARVHRDPFEPILSILEADSPAGEYRKITDEILRLMPDSRLYPVAAAEAVRSFLMLRLGLHTGLRQKNLRQLRVCPKGGVPSSERQLEDARCGELRWSDRYQGWEVLIPSIAFKNSTSSFFGSKPFRLVLPDLADLYAYIDAYVDKHRAVLLRGAKDPGTFFVKTVKTKSKSAAYDQTTFYEAWRLTTQRYGIYNPYTGRGAIKGLLPHGPHNVRDVLATHILKQTGSYEQASYAIQDTPEMVAQHYGRFLPQDKAALAAQILNKVWEAA